MTSDSIFWDKLAVRYSKQPVANPDAFERKIAATKARMTRDDIVLDIGCGTGSLALCLMHNAAHIHGLDVSSEMIRIATAKAQAAQATNVTFHVGPFDHTFTQFAPRSLNGICAYSLLHLVNDRRATLAQIFGLLKPGGFFVSSTPCLGGSWVPYRPILWCLRAIGKAPHVALFDKRALQQELSDAGFVDTEFVAVGAEQSIAFVIARKPLGA